MKLFRFNPPGEMGDDERALVGIGVRRLVFLDEGDRVKEEVESNVEIAISEIQLLLHLSSLKIEFNRGRGVIDKNYLSGVYV